MPAPDLSGKHVLLTGASGRLGGTLAELLLREGASVTGADLREPGYRHDRFAFEEVDTSDEHAVERLFARLEQRGRRVDALIHTVGAWAGAPLADTSLDDFRTILDLNLTTAFICFREAVRHWRRLPGPGRLVAIASMQGVGRGVPEQAPYSAAKAGVARLVESVGRELQGDGITAAAVAPSMILYGDEPEGTAGIPAVAVAELCAYLASEAGSSHSGTVIPAFGSMLP